MAQDDDLEASTTEGYKPGEKKSVAEYAQLDANDESLNRWKASLGLGAGSTGGSIGEPGDMRKVVILELALETTGRPDISIDLTTAAGIEQMKNTSFTIKEGAEYRMRVKFRVQHEVISGLRYLQVVKRKGIRVDKMEEMMGSYGPSTNENTSYTKTFATEEAPSGMLARGKYDAVSKFTDDDKHEHLLFNWSFEIKKNWD